MWLRATIYIWQAVTSWEEAMRTAFQGQHISATNVADVVHTEQSTSHGCSLFIVDLNYKNAKLSYLRQWTKNMNTSHTGH